MREYSLIINVAPMPLHVNQLLYHHPYISAAINYGTYVLALPAEYGLTRGAYILSESFWESFFSRNNNESE